MLIGNIYLTAQLADWPRQPQYQYSGDIVFPAPTGDWGKVVYAGYKRPVAPWFIHMHRIGSGRGRLGENLFCQLNPIPTPYRKPFPFNRFISKLDCDRQDERFFNDRRSYRNDDGKTGDS